MRAPEPGRAKTRLIPHLGAKNAAALAHAFALDALAKARRTGLPLIIAGDALGGVFSGGYFRRLSRRFDSILLDQGEGSLGIRMRRAFEPYLAKGALLIGTDTPSLPLAALQRNHALLRRNRVVFGPSLDGGYYALGLRAALPDVFRGIRWGGAQVLRDSVARLQTAGTPFRLGPSWYDIDRWSDLLLLTEHLRQLRSNPCPATSAVLHRLGLL